MDITYSTGDEVRYITTWGCSTNNGTRRQSLEQNRHQVQKTYFAVRMETKKRHGLGPKQVVFLETMFRPFLLLRFHAKKLKKTFISKKVCQLINISMCIVLISSSAFTPSAFRTYVICRTINTLSCIPFKLPCTAPVPLLRIRGKHQVGHTSKWWMAAR